MTGNLFSAQANEYARYRPVYPSGLFEFVAGQCHEHKLAWDSGTGNGQAAFFLANYFERVYATDINLNQIKNTFIHPRVEYKVEAVEECSLPRLSVDAVVAATAAHWFDMPGYYKQVDRVLKAEGVLAIWSYADCTISPAIDKVVKQYHKLIKSYWHSKINVNINRYSTLTFPYPLIEVPGFYMEKEFTPDEFLCYLFTWSSTQTYIAKHNQNPVDLIRANLKKAWKGDGRRRAVWKLFMKIGRKPSSI